MQDRKRLRERFDELLWRWAGATAGVKSAADDAETSIHGAIIPIWSNVVATSKPATR